MVKQASGNKWDVGVTLQVFAVETDYLKTKNDKSMRDNLENLPRV